MGEVFPSCLPAARPKAFLSSSSACLCLVELPPRGEKPHTCASKVLTWNRIICLLEFALFLTAQFVLAGLMLAQVPAVLQQLASGWHQAGVWLCTPGRGSFPAPCWPPGPKGAAVLWLWVMSGVASVWLSLLRVPRPDLTSLKNM